ncbi:Crp/Fnr family transcriptional regulator [Arenibacter sp. 6A1]|uniref:Crp/Fnr family transcriptional regulator n=1 Tax=Arenibacter sp. 6A1 TaxID=2720391 RepID=UPI001444CFAB|nr:Crp/Fnr family transcriptional regulator [Arenibacter sp. 6A1]NKI26428.1 Crp/Fnr family transcriptional regulator [Arenibacter sp. 6A1]
MTTNNDLHKNLFIIIYLNAIVPLSSELKRALGERIKKVGYSKGEVINREGEYFTKLCVIKKGIVRGYFMEDTLDITTWISSDNEMFTSITGFFRNRPAKENIQCLEDIYCEYLEYDDLQYCIDHFPEMARLYRIMIEEYYLHAEHRAFIARVPSAQKRWKLYMENHSLDVINRIPKKYIASLLAMRPETLSRIMRQEVNV